MRVPLSPPTKSRKSYKAPQSTTNYSPAFITHLVACVSARRPCRPVRLSRHHPFSNRHTSHTLQVQGSQGDIAPPTCSKYSQCDSPAVAMPLWDATACVCLTESVGNCGQEQRGP